MSSFKINFDDRVRAKFSLVERQREEMHGYQRDIAVPFMRAHPFSLICIDMGLGKTISALTVISDLLQEFATEKVLVIAPLRVATDTWPTEIAAWQHTAWMNYTLIRADGRRTKEDCARDPATIHVINREQVEWLVYFWKEKWPYRTVIIDECFIAGTPVATPNGDVAIEKLSVGDLVQTPYGSMPVKKVHRKKTTRIVRVFLQNGTAIACTPDHRFLTDAGWLPACQLEGRLLYDQSDFASLQVQALRRNILDLEVSPDLLRTFMFSKSGVAKRRNGERERSIEEWHSWKRENALEQRHPLAGRNEGQVASAWQQGAFSEDTRRERDRDVSPRKNVVRNVDQRLGLQPRGDCREGAGQRLSEPLQDRLRLAGEDDCFGSGWFEPQSDQTSSARSEERGSSCGTRVVRVSRDEQGSGVNVYDISVEGAPYYFAQGCLVHNCSSFKDHSSHRFKALAKVRRTDGLITRMHLLTATPAAETYEHLFTQLYLLDLGQRLGKNITWYRDAYFSYNKYSMKYKLRPGAEEVILEKIADISLVMKSKDHLPRTEPTVVQRKVKLSQHQLDLIRKLERDFIITLTDGTEIEAKTAAMLSSMLLQMASGSVYETILVGDYETEDLKKVKKVHHLHEHKIETLKEMFEEAQTQGETLLVAYYFQSSLARLRKAFPKAILMDKEGKCIKDWNKGKIPMMLIHPQSAGHGLNLQHGGHILVFFDLIYSLEYYLQTIGRLDRQGQKNPVIVEMLVAEGTRDTDVYECLKNKEDAQEKLFSILKRMIRKLRNKDRHS